MYRATVPIKGMHCRSCELLIEDELLKISCVEKAVVSQKKGTAEIFFIDHLTQKQVEHAVHEAGYEIGVTEKKPLFSKNPNDYAELAICSAILLMALFFANEFGLFKLGSSLGNNYSSLPIVFLIGITAGVSTCMALVGGLVLGASARFAEKHPNATSLQKFKPHVFFNIGRIASYFILGGVIGYLGSFFQISTSVLGLLTIVVGMVMLILGFQLTEIFPRLSSISFTLPSGISKLLGIQRHKQKEYSHTNSMLMGALTFFLPCGFTQAMQLFAISSGNPVIGALTMGVFALGTAPGLLSIGGLTAVIKGAFAKTFFRFAGLVVIGLALFNITNGYNLTGINVLAFASKVAIAQANDPNVTIENGVQIVKMTQSGSGYSPNSFTVKKGVPVRWVITSTNQYTCAASIVMSSYGVRQSLQQGENIIEFTPNEIGTIRFSCSMGMYTGVFNVVDNNGQANNQASPKATACGGGSGGCGCGGARKPVVTDPNTTPAQPIVQQDATTNQEVQVLQATYTQDKDVQPNQFSVKAGQPVRLEIDAKDSGYGCMGSMTIPGLTSKVEVFQAGQTMIFEFTPSKPGTYQMTCAMGVARGSIIVNNY